MGEALRKALAVSSLALALVVAGCGSNPSDSTGGGDATSGQEMTESSATSKPSGPPRTGPAKVTDVADKCSIVNQPQWQSEGADQAPRELELNDRLGCKYQQGQAGSAGWSVFVAVNGESSYDEEVSKLTQSTAAVDLGGYPAVKYELATNCILYANISDQGLLVANAGRNSSSATDVNLCERAEKFAQLAIQNLPDA
ncbi:DUF3558 domain-containing protein [Saccharopolyspora sp. NPDC000359]|uniref:DUF3558 domain-containing protein n=1 Tax=Saccharopolyspora sp. NPDC000359 TaxID=3154251 RepID=UPI00331ECE47